MIVEAKINTKLGKKLLFGFVCLAAPLVATVYLAVTSLVRASVDLRNVGDQVSDRLIPLRKLDHDLLEYRMLHYQALSKPTQAEAEAVLSRFAGKREAIDRGIAQSRGFLADDAGRAAHSRLARVWEAYKIQDLEFLRTLRAWDKDATNRMIKQRFLPVALKLGPECENLTELVDRQAKLEADNAGLAAARAANASILICVVAISAGLAIGMLLREVLRRLRRLSDQVSAIGAEDRSPKRVDEGANDEFGQLARMTNAMLEAKERYLAVLDAAHDELERLISSIPFALMVFDAEGRISTTNDVARLLFPHQLKAAKTAIMWDLPMAWDALAVRTDVLTSVSADHPTSYLSVRIDTTDGSGYYDIVVCQVQSSERDSHEYLLSAVDVTERESLQNKVAQSQKLEAIGSLAAGIAHEINTPTQFVADNIRFLRDACASLIAIADHQDALIAGMTGEEARAVSEMIQAERQAHDYGYLVEEVPLAISQSIEGLSRVASIVAATKEFAHPDGDTKGAVDINRAIETTLSVSRNVWKDVAKVETDLDPKLPLVSGHGGQINQVILNLVINASQAVEEKRGRSGELGLIRIETGLNRLGQAEVSISDDGCGIPECVKSKVYDPFFTTKEVGRGTGQGLSLVHNVVVTQHGGTIDFTTEEGLGTTFQIALPTVGAHRTTEEEAA